MARQLCCRGMCKNLLRSDGQQQSYGKAKFPLNLNCGQKNVSETGPWPLLLSSIGRYCFSNLLYPLWPSDAIWGPKSWSTVVQVMASSLMAQAITWTNVDLSRFSDFHLREISQEILNPSITKIIFKITYLKFHLNFPGTNELSYLVRMQTGSPGGRPHIAAEPERYTHDSTDEPEIKFQNDVTRYRHYSVGGPGIT